MVPSGLTVALQERLCIVYFVHVTIILHSTIQTKSIYLLKVTDFFPRIFLKVAVIAEAVSDVVTMDRGCISPSHGKSPVINHCCT